MIKNWKFIMPLVLLLIAALAVVGFNQGDSTDLTNMPDVSKQMNQLFNKIYENYAGAVVSVRSEATVHEIDSKEGTGFFINNQGYVVTAYENIKQGQVATVLFNKKSVEMTVLKSDEKSGLALLKPAANLNVKNFLTLETSTNPKLADSCIMLSNILKSISLTGKPTMRTGEISGFYKPENGSRNLFETSINYDQSSIGAPIFNIDGKVIGLTSKFNKAGRWMTTAISSTIIDEFVKTVK